MGEIAEMMLDGTLCEGCGEFMGNTIGYPRRCAGCERDGLKGTKAYACQFCHKGFRTAQGKDEHEKQVHAKRLARSRTSGTL